MYKSKKSAKDEKLPDIKQNDIFNMAKQIMKDSKLVLKKKKKLFVSNQSFQCARYQGLAPAIDKRELLSGAVVDNDSVEVVDSFC